jgi:hypothetical protein
MVGVSLLSAFAQFWIKLKKGEARFSFAEVIGESVVCMSAGITCGLLLMDHVSTPVMLGAVSVAAHMGTRFIYALDNALTRAIERRLGDADRRD